MLSISTPVAEDTIQIMLASTGSTNIPHSSKSTGTSKEKLDKGSTDDLSPIFQSEAEIQQCKQSIAV